MILPKRLRHRSKALILLKTMSYGIRILLKIILRGMTLRHIILLALVLSLFSCDSFLGKSNFSSSKEGSYSEGRIVYKITYLDYGNSTMNPALLPKKMILEFNQDSCVNSIDGFMGFFHLGNITYFKTKTCSTHLKVLDKNYSFAGHRRESMCCFECMDNMKIKKDTTIKSIAGLNSRKAIVSIPGSNERFEIFYTNEINLSHPNSTNPYKKIDGVLTQFRLRMGPYYMLFTAAEFSPNAVPKSTLKVPKDSQKVSREEMTYVLYKLIE